MTRVTRGAAWGPWGGAAGRTRDVTATGPEGRTYSSESQGGAVRGPLGNTYAGGSRFATASGWAGSASRASGWRAAGTRFSGDYGLAHYSSVAATGVGRTTYWSHGYVGGWANDVRTGFLHYGCFTPATATVTVTVPESATVLLDGSPTTQTGTQRQFVTPPLAPGKNFYYDIEARWAAADGRPVDHTKKVLVTAGANVQVNFVK